MSYDKKKKLHIVAVVAVIRNPDGKYLVLKRSEKEKAYPGYWSFPGGKAEGTKPSRKRWRERFLKRRG